MPCPVYKHLNLALRKYLYTHEVANYFSLNRERAQAHANLKLRASPLRVCIETCEARELRFCFRSFACLNFARTSEDARMKINISPQFIARNDRRNFKPVHFAIMYRF